MSLSLPESYSQTNDTENASRVMLRLRGIDQSDAVWEEESIPKLQSVLRRSGCDVVVASRNHELFIDAETPDDNTLGVLCATAEQLDKALVDVFMPAELAEARIGTMSRAIGTRIAWDVLSKDEAADVTPIAQEIMARQRDRTMGDDLISLLYNS